MNKELSHKICQRGACYKAIREAKEELSKNDYKIIKCMEAQLIDAKLPYDIVLLTARRNELRELINTKNEEQLKLREEIVELMKENNNEVS